MAFWHKDNPVNIILHGHCPNTGMREGIQGYERLTYRQINILMTMVAGDDSDETRYVIISKGNTNTNGDTLCVCVLAAAMFEN